MFFKGSLSDDHAGTAEGGNFSALHVAAQKEMVTGMVTNSPVLAGQGRDQTSQATRVLLIDQHYPPQQGTARDAARRLANRRLQPLGHLSGL